MKKDSKKKKSKGREGRANGAQGKRGDITIAADRTAAQDGNMPLFARDLFQQMRDSDDARAVS